MTWWMWRLPMSSPGDCPRSLLFPLFYATKAQFIADINLLHSRGQKVLLSIGGANATVQLNSSTDIQNFATSVGSIIREFGFDGFDLDLEGTSVILNNGDTDFRSPTTPSIVNLISAVNQILDQFPGGIILSMAPETAYVQGGYGTYSSIFGAYLPIIHALRDSSRTSMYRTTTPGACTEETVPSTIRRLRIFLLPWLTCWFQDFGSTHFGKHEISFSRDSAPKRF